MPSSQPSTDPSLIPSVYFFKLLHLSVQHNKDPPRCKLVCNPSSCRFSNHKSSIFILVYCTYNPWQWKIQTFIGKYECNMEVNRRFASQPGLTFWIFRKFSNPPSRGQVEINILSTSYYSIMGATIGVNQFTNLEGDPRALQVNPWDPLGTRTPPPSKLCLWWACAGGAWRCNGFCQKRV